MELSSKQTENLRKRKQMEAHLLKLAVSCVSLNLRSVELGVNISADKYLEILNEKYKLTEQYADAILAQHGTTFDNQQFALHDTGDSVSRGDELRGRGCC